MKDSIFWRRWVKPTFNYRLLTFNYDEDKEDQDNELKNFQEATRYRYFPKTKEELKELVEKLILERGNKADLNDIYTGDITDMSSLFSHSHFNGDISKWNMSKVSNMSYMFFGSLFNGDISNWDVSNVEDIFCMFAYSKFNGDISNWKLNKASDLDRSYMLYESEKSSC